MVHPYHLPDRWIVRKPDLSYTCAANALAIRYTIWSLYLLIRLPLHQGIQYIRLQQTKELQSLFQLVYRGRSRVRTRYHFVFLTGAFFAAPGFAPPVFAGPVAAGGTTFTV